MTLLRSSHETACNFHVEPPRGAVRPGLAAGRLRHGRPGLPGAEDRTAAGLVAGRGRGRARRGAGRRVVAPLRRPAAEQPGRARAGRQHRCAHRPGAAARGARQQRAGRIAAVAQRQRLRLGHALVQRRAGRRLQLRPGLRRGLGDRPVRRPAPRRRGRRCRRHGQRRHAGQHARVAGRRGGAQLRAAARL